MAEGNLNNLSRNEVKAIWKNIDRKLKRVTQDPEISGVPNKAFTSPDMTPLHLIDNNYTSLGSISANALSQLQDEWQLIQSDKLKRYEKLKSAQEHPEIDGALNIYADEATTEDQDGIIIHAQHPDDEAQRIVEDMFERTGIEEKSWQIIRNMCGYGDEFYEIVIALSEKSILKIDKLPKEVMERVEENNILQGFKVNTDSMEEINQNYTYQMNYQTAYEKDEDLIYPFRVLHFKIPSSKYGVYGQSVIDSIVGTIEQLKLMEKALVVARVTRAPERRVYTIDVGNLQGEKAIRYARSVVANFKGSKKIHFYDENRTTDLQKDIFGTVEDLVIPKRQGSEGNQITTLEQANNLGDIADIEFLRDKIFPSIGIPRQYFYDDTFANSNTNLSSKSVPFAKKIKRVQRFFLNQIYKLAIIELKLKGYSNDSISQLVLSMNNPSNIDDREQITVEMERWGLIGTIKALNAEKTFFPDYLLYQDFLKLNKEEIMMVLKLNMLQDNGQNPFEIFDIDDRPEGAEDLAVSAGPGGGGPGGAPGGMGMPGGEMGGEGIPGEALEGGETEGDLPEEVENALGPPPEPEVPEGETPETASADIYVKDKKHYIEEIKKKKQKILNKLITDNMIANVQEKREKHTVQYDKFIKRTKRIAFAEMFINGHLVGLDKVHTKVKIYDESDVTNELVAYKQD